MKVNLSSQPEIVQRTFKNLLYREKAGPFATIAPAAWQELLSLVGGKWPSETTGLVTLFRLDSSNETSAKGVYQAGITLSSGLESVPEGLKIRDVHAERYACFLLKGPYTQLPEAYPAALATLQDKGLNLRDDFTIENYLNDPSNTPNEDDLRTELLFPVGHL